MQINKRLSVIAGAMALLLVGGCVSPVKPLTEIPKDILPNVGVAKITVTAVPGEAVPPEVLGFAREAIEREVRNCAKGAQAMEIEVRLDSFKRRNAAATILIGDSNSLTGEVKFKAQDGGQVVGHYYVEEVQGGGGLLGLAMMSNAESAMSDRFARRICSDILKK